MTCEQFRESVDCYVDGELSAEAKTAVERHRAECVGCDTAARQIAELRASVRRAVSDIPLPGHLEARIRTATAAPFPRRRDAGVGGRRWWAVAAAVLLLVAGGLALSAGRAAPGGAADVFERMALQVSDTGAVVIEGTVLCRDCELEHRYGVQAPCRRIGHHGAIATADGRIWNLVDQEPAADLIHNEALLGRRVLVHGRMYRGARALVVERVDILG